MNAVATHGLNLSVFTIPYCGLFCRNWSLFTAALTVRIHVDAISIGGRAYEH